MQALTEFIPNSNPLNQQWLSALIAAIPIFTMLLTLGILRWKAHYAALASWGVSLIVACTAFKMPWILGISDSASGFLYGVFPIVWILLTAIWMYEVTVASGRFNDLRRTFFLISDDPRIVGLIIAFCFGGLLEALAGFGAPVAIAGAMLIAVGFSPIRAALIALMADTVPVAFGAVGLPVTEAASISKTDVMHISPITGHITAILSIIVPLLILFIMDGKKGLKQCWPVALVIGLSFAATKWIISASPMFKLTEMFAAIISVIATVIFLKFWRPKTDPAVLSRIGKILEPKVEKDYQTHIETNDSEDKLTGRRIFMALVPYILVTLVFSLAAIPAVADFMKYLDTTFLKFHWPLSEDLMSASGKANGHQNFILKLFTSPGILLAVVALLTGFIYKMSLSAIFGVLWTQVKRMKMSALTIGLVVALAYVMGDSGQTLALGLFISAAFGAAYVGLSPVIGWIGTYVTGSDTSANILFGKLQADIGGQIGTGTIIGADGMKELLVGANAAGGVSGKMISPQSLTIAATAIGLAGTESVILRRAFKWTLMLLVLMCALVLLMSTPVLSWIMR